MADKMGFGKTCVAIGLASLKVGELPQPAWTDVKSKGFIPTGATLIMCPSHLLEQWEGELKKFLGDGVEISKPTSKSEIMSMSEEISVTFPGSLLKSKLDITVGRTDSRWSGSLTAEVQKVGPKAKKHLGDRAPQVGDLVQKLHCSGLKKPDGTAFTMSAREVSLLQRCFKGEIRCYVSERTPMGGASSSPDFPVRRTMRMAEGQVTPKSKVTLTLKRPPKTSGAATRVVGSPKKGTSSNVLKVLILRQASEMKRLKQGDFLKFHLVLASTAIQASQVYAESITRACRGGRGSKLMGEKIELLPEVLRRACSGKAAFAGLLQKSPAILEHMLWHRVILDEFHESEAWEYRVREMLRGLRANFKWGLSGTPPMQDAQAVAEVANLLGFANATKAQAEIVADAGYWGNSVRRRLNASHRWFRLHQAELQEAAEAFVANHVRQSSSQLIERIGVKEYEVFVDHTSEERLIYRQACHDQGVFDLASGYCEITTEARQELLKRCAHFDLGEAQCAGSAVQQLGSSKRMRLSQVESQLQIEVARATEFGAWTAELQEAIRSKCKSLHPDAQTLVSKILDKSAEELRSTPLPAVESSSSSSSSSSAAVQALQQALKVEVTLTAQDGSLRMRRLVRLVQPIPESEYYCDQNRHVVVHAIARHIQDEDADQVLADLQICEQVCPKRNKKGLLVKTPRTEKLLMKAFEKGIMELVCLLDKAHRSLQFYGQQLKQLTGSHAGEQECSICLESKGDLSTMAILPCSHVFHVSCIRACLRLQPHCPECRAPLEASQISSVVMELRSPEPEPKPAKPSKLTQAWKRHGSKLNAVAAKLREIRAQDSTAKALIFVQWADLEVKVCQALKDHGINFLHVGNAKRGPAAKLSREDGQVLRRFQDETGKNVPYVLVLSLQRAASGTNLTSASHVLFVHPMNAETVATATAYERQALGRVRRIGQTRKDVSVWRFVTRNTVEEHMHSLHRNGAEPAQ